MKGTSIHILLLSAMVLASCSERIGGDDPQQAAVKVTADSTAIYTKTLNVMVDCPASKDIDLTYTIINPSGEEWEPVQRNISHRAGVTDTLKVDFNLNETFGKYRVAIKAREVSLDENVGKELFSDTLSFRYLPSILGIKTLYYSSSSSYGFIVRPVKPKTSVTFTHEDEKFSIGNVSSFEKNTQNINILQLRMDISVTAVGISRITVHYDDIDIPLDVICKTKAKAEIVDYSAGNLALKIYDTEDYGIRTVDVSASIGAAARMDYYSDNLLTDAVLANIAFEEEGNNGRESSLRKHTTDTLSYDNTKAGKVEISSAAGIGQLILDEGLIDSIKDGHPNVKFTQFVTDYGQSSTGIQVPRFNTDWAYFIPSDFSITLSLRALDGFVEFTPAKSLTVVPEGMTEDSWKKWADALNVTIAEE